MKGSEAKWSTNVEFAPTNMGITLKMCFRS